MTVKVQKIQNPLKFRNARFQQKSWIPAADLPGTVHVIVGIVQELVAVVFHQNQHANCRLES